MAGRPECARGGAELGGASTTSLVSRGRPERHPGGAGVAAGKRGELRKNGATHLRSKFFSATLGGMEGEFRYRGRVITAAEVEFIRQLIAQHPHTNRRQLSLRVCEAWGWKQANGALRDMVCRGLLLELARAGHLQLTARVNHLEEAGSTQARILLQGLAQKIKIRISEANAWPGLAAEAIGVQCSAHGVGMQVHLRRNGADFPMLGVKQVTDLSDLFIGNHVSPREKDSPIAPGARRSDRRPRSPRTQRPTHGKKLPPEGLRPAAEPEAPSDSHRGKHQGKIDLSRELLSAGDTRVGAGDDRSAPPGRDFGDSGG